MSKTTKIVIGAIIAIIVIGGIWYVAAKQPKQFGNIKIGVVLPLSGDIAIYGDSVKNAVLLAVENSGIKDKVQLVIEDDNSCDKNSDVSIAQKFVNIDKVNAVIGPMCSSATLATLPVTDPAKIIMVSPTSTSKIITKSGYNFFFRTMESDSAKAILAANFAYGKGYRKAALIFDIANDSFLQQKQDIKETFTAAGGAIVEEESFRTKDVDFRSQLTKIKNSGADIVIVGGFPTESALVIKQARELGINLQIMGAGAETGTPELITLAGSAAEGFIFPTSEASTNKEHSDFINAYKAKFGEDPQGYGSAEGYDAAMLLVKAIQNSDGTGESIKDNFYNLGQNYMGASGTITFDNNGDVKKPMLMNIVKNGQFVPYGE